MISKERLETLIKEGATVYSTHWKEEVDLSQKCEVVKKSFCDGKKRLVLIVHEDEEHSPHYMLENLTEDIEGAKWEEEFGCIERIERLELPNWEEIENTINHFCYFTDCYGRECCLSYKRATNKVKLKYWVGVGDGEEEFECGVWEFTKENYILACRKCKEIFLGEKIKNI